MNSRQRRVARRKYERAYLSRFGCVPPPDSPFTRARVMPTQGSVVQFHTLSQGSR